jgi:predicted AlkP superfamily phosphohydrolase/phosphomutase
MDGLLSRVPAYASWPPELQLGHGNEEEYIRTTAELIDAQFDAMEYSMSWLGQWDLFFGTVQFPDQVFHWFWKYDDPDHPLHATANPRYKGVVRDVHQQLDRRIARMRDLAGTEVLTIVLSDHGNGPLLRDLYVDTLLADRGWTNFKRTPFALAKRGLRRLGFTPSSGFRLGHGVGLGGFVRRAMRFKRSMLDRAIATVYMSTDDVDWSRTSAYAYGTWGNIYLNVAGREPQGLIAPEQYESARAAIIADLQSVIDSETGSPIFGEVLSRDDVYEGTEIADSPDIFLVPRDDTVHPVALLPFAEKNWISPPFSVESGWHRRDGLLLMHGPGVVPGHTISAARIEDAGATVLAYMGAGLSEDLDGKPIADAFTPGVIDADLRPSAATTVAATQPYSKEEQDLIDRRLSELGY